jgi:hypothetical protein
MNTKEDYLNEAEKDWNLPITENMFQSDKIKLIKNTKGYNWEISLLSLDTNKIKEINDDMIAKFGLYLKVGAENEQG